MSQADDDLDDGDEANFVSSSNDVDDLLNNDGFIDDEEEPCNLRTQVRRLSQSFPYNKDC